MSIVFLTAPDSHARGPVRSDQSRSSLKRALLLGALSFAGALAGAGMSSLSGAPRHSSGSVLAFASLTFAGGRMLLEAVRPPEAPPRRACRTSVAVDALLVGLSLPFFPVDPGGAAALTGGIVFALGALDSLLPEETRERLHPWLSAAGGLLLTGIGMQALL